MQENCLVVYMRCPCQGLGSIPNQGTKITQASRCDQKKKKKRYKQPGRHCWLISTERKKKK